MGKALIIGCGGVGYNSNTGAAIYMDPELACMYSVNAGYFLQDYNIVLTGIK